MTRDPLGFAASAERRCELRWAAGGVGVSQTGRIRGSAFDPEIDEPY